MQTTTTGKLNIQIEISKKVDIKEYSCYFEDKYKSSEAEYLAAKSEMLAAVQKA